MNIATLRIEGSGSSLKSLKKVLLLECDTEWKKGDKRRHGRTNSLSGFSVTVADAINPSELTRLIRLFLLLCKNNKIVFPNHNVSAELAVGFTVGDSEQFVAGLELSPSDLLLFAECGITLNVTAYPTSDEANAEENIT